ncbi:unnamed protein product, partial [Ectocarpus sp. 12 AP-2014]
MKAKLVTRQKQNIVQQYEAKQSISTLGDLPATSMAPHRCITYSGTGISQQHSTKSGHGHGFKAHSTNNNERQKSSQQVTLVCHSQYLENLRGRITLTLLRHSHQTHYCIWTFCEAVQSPHMSPCLPSCLITPTISGNPSWPCHPQTLARCSLRTSRSIWKFCVAVSSSHFCHTPTASGNFSRPDHPHALSVILTFKPTVSGNSAWPCNPRPPRNRRSRSARTPHGTAGSPSWGTKT